MRKIIVLIVLVILPCAAFAQLQIGPTALLNFLIAPDDVKTQAAFIGNEGLSIDDFTFGLDTRLKLGIFQGSAMGLYSPGIDASPSKISLYLDAGISIDILMLRLGIGAGPNLIFAIGEDLDKPVFFGANVKANVDLILGGIDISLSYLMLLNDFSQESLENLSNNIVGNVGISVLFQL